MLAPLRDYPYPKDPKASTLLCATKDLYVTRLSVVFDPSVPGFEDTRWITSEDVNVEHSLDVFTSTNPNPDDAWNAFNGFMAHLYWHKPRQTVHGPNIEQLPDDHLHKPRALLELSRLFESVGNHVEQKRLLTHASNLWRERGAEYWVAHSLHMLACTHRHLSLCEEGVRLTKEALGALCRSQLVLGDISCSKGGREKAFHHYNLAIGIASPSHWHDQLFWVHHSLAVTFCDANEFDNAHAHIKRAKPHAVYDKYFLGRAVGEQGRIWYQQGRVENAVSEAFCAIEIYETLGAAGDLEKCRAFLQEIERSAKCCLPLVPSVSFWERIYLKCLLTFPS